MMESRRPERFNPKTELERVFYKVVCGIVFSEENTEEDFAKTYTAVLLVMEARTKKEEWSFDDTIKEYLEKVLKSNMDPAKKAAIGRLIRDA